MIAMIVGLLPTAVAAELPRKTTTPPHDDRTKINPCAAYGAGFVWVAGSSTCVKVGGTIRVEGGRSH